MTSLIKSAISLVSLLLALIPVWVWLAIYNFSSPDGFWQKFAVLGIGVFVFGGVQVALLFWWAMANFVVWFGD